MADLNISSQDGLVQATVRQRQETYYLVTEDHLSSLKSKSILADIFLLISSLTWGAYISIVLTLKSLPEVADSKMAAYETILKLKTIENVVLIIGIIFTVLTLFMFYQSFTDLKKLKTGGAVEIPNT